MHPKAMAVDSENRANDDNAHGNKMSCSEAENAEKELDADLIQMKTLRATTSTHDDWLHRGPYLHDIAFHTYAEYIDHVRLPLCTC